jgi:hypothetical protein
VPGRGEYLKMKQFLYRARFDELDGPSKSSSVSVGKPTMMSPESMSGRPELGLVEVVSCSDR